jgi:hypothetical protein
MKPMRLGCRVAAAACVMVAVGLSQAHAQFPPPPGQSQAAAPDPAFPPPPGQGRAPAQDSAFPPPPGQNRVSAQDPAFPPPGQRAPSHGISIAPGGGGSFGPPAGGSFAPPGGGGFSGPPPQMSEAQKVCTTFPSIREEVEKSGGLIRSAGERKAPREEVCPLFKAFAVKEGKMLSFLETNEKLCGIPPKIVAQMKTGHARTIQMRNTVCSAAPMGSAGPTLSDALGAPIIADDTSAKRPGRGTFDTLTGNALQK